MGHASHLGRQGTHPRGHIPALLLPARSGWRPFDASFPTPRAPDLRRVSAGLILRGTPWFRSAGVPRRLDSLSALPRAAAGPAPIHSRLCSAASAGRGRPHVRRGRDPGVIPSVARVARLRPELGVVRPPARGNSVPCSSVRPHSSSGPEYTAARVRLQGLTRMRTSEGAERRATPGASSDHVAARRLARSRSPTRAALWIRDWRRGFVYRDKDFGARSRAKIDCFAAP